MTLKEIRDDLGKAKGRRDRLLARRGEGGFELQPSDNRVTTAEAEVARLDAALRRLTETNDKWSATWHRHAARWSE
jgi:hypothetical protein